MLLPYPSVWTLIAAETLLILTRSRTITVLVKSKTQRSRLEQHEVERGLLRSLLVEFLLLVPASCFLLLAVAPVIPKLATPGDYRTEMARSALLGMISYGFPFALAKRVITRIALNTLREFSALVPPGKEGPE